MNNLPMQETLMQKLLQYITENNSDLLVRLEEEETVSNYLLSKVSTVASILERADLPDYIKEETCLTAMTQSLQPSKYNYICRVLEEEFASTYWKLKRSRILKYEAINLTLYCQPLFEAVHFSEANEENRLLYYAVAGAVLEYFDKEPGRKKELGNGIQQPEEAQG